MEPSSPTQANQDRSIARTLTAFADTPLDSEQRRSCRRSSPRSSQYVWSGAVSICSSSAHTLHTGTGVGSYPRLALKFVDLRRFMAWERRCFGIHHFSASSHFSLNLTTFPKLQIDIPLNNAGEWVMSGPPDSLQIPWQGHRRGRPSTRWVSRMHVLSSFIHSWRSLR